MNAREIRQIAVGLQSGIEFPMETPQHPMILDIVELARETGAPRARLLSVVADALDDNETIQREATIAATATRHSALVLSFLPMATAVAASLFGVNALGFLVTQPAGWVCLAVGFGATFAGWRWMAALRSRVTVPALETGVLADCVAEVLSATGLTPDATEFLAGCAERWDATPEWNDIRGVREVGRNTGIPVANLLRSHAAELRRSARFAVRGQIEELPGKLLMPLGLCLFPAFITLTVIPAVASMAQGFFRSSG